MKTAITIWVDESTDIIIDDLNYTLVGYLITNSDTEEFLFLNALKQARKELPMCWDTMHGTEIGLSEERKIKLIDRWLGIFKGDKVDKYPETYFHAFLYKKDENYLAKCQTYEHYFASQAVTSLANKLRREGVPYETVFADVGTVTVLQDRRRSHSAEITSNSDGGSEISRWNNLEEVYKSEIKSQFENIAGRNTRNSDLKVRFSFVSPDCFDGMQFADIMLYLIRMKLENKDNAFTELFDKHFLSHVDKHTAELGFQKIYELDKKFNFFRSDD